jgi:hypothetical protein
MKNRPGPSISILADIILIFQSSKLAGWEEISHKTISRTLYFVSTLYHYFHKDKNNIFKDYKFFMEKDYPRLDHLDEYLTTLEGKNIIIKKNNQFMLNKSMIESHDQYFRVPFFTNRRIWISLVIKILSIYGEDTIYDFIFRDPEFSYNNDRNEYNILMNMDSKSQTYITLEHFHAAFEEALKLQNRESLSIERYVILYFEYIFSTIIKTKELL